MNRIRTFAYSLTAALALSATAAPLAHAEDKLPAAAASPTTDASAEVKAATAIENREPAGEAASFKAGEKIYVWSKIKGAEGEDVEHVWKRDGKEIFRAKLEVQSKAWRTNSRLQKPKAGDYVVEVIGKDKTLGSVSFKVE